jgi:hypothetical protein
MPVDDDLLEHLSLMRVGMPGGRKQFQGNEVD